MLLRLSFVSILLLLLLNIVSSQNGESNTMITDSMQSFSSAIKAGRIVANVETPVFYFNEGVPGVMTEQWYTGVFDEKTVIKMYIDNEIIPSIEFKLLLGHGVGFTMSQENGNAPWNTRRISHDAANGGLYNNYQIPFSLSINITITHWKSGDYWYIARGCTNVPVIIGNGLQLPNNGGSNKNLRLKLYKNENILLTPLEFITLANVSGTAGLVYQVTIEANSTDYNYLEACFRVKIDGDNGYQFLSSGTEDFFLSAYYFNRGLYHGDDAGCTFFDSKGAMSAYKFFENDPILFTQSMELVWRCGEEQTDSDGCPNTYPSMIEKGNLTHIVYDKPQIPLKNLKLANTNVTTYTWVYEYMFD